MTEERLAMTTNPDSTWLRPTEPTEPVTASYHAQQMNDEYLFPFPTARVLSPLKPPLADITPRKAPQLNVNTRKPIDIDSPDPEWDYSINRAEVCPLDEANILTSEAQGRPGIHKFMIDVDLPVVLVPSTTPGHAHLYIDVDIEWPRYVELLRALALAGVIEMGYARASIHRGYTSLRPPWVPKTDDEKGISR
jgi:hypothetical protein